MQYSLAYNGDLDLIHKTADLEDIEYYYGTVSDNPVGSGRPVYEMADALKAVYMKWPL